VGRLGSVVLVKCNLFLFGPVNICGNDAHKDRALTAGVQIILLDRTNNTAFIHHKGRHYSNIKKKNIQKILFKIQNTRIQGVPIKMPPTVFHHYCIATWNFVTNLFSVILPPLTRLLYIFHSWNFTSRILVQFLVVHVGNFMVKFLAPID